MPSDTDWQRAALTHCLWMAARDPVYAQWAAENAEKRFPVLAGLGDKVKKAIAKHARKESGDEAAL